jgi:hypothetical protein
MAGTNLCEAWCARWGGALVGQTSHATAFAILGAVSLLALLPLWCFDEPGRSPQ